jgi:hypothetical protein
VTTLFFIDTAHNIIQYLEIISNLLREGGVCPTSPTSPPKPSPKMFGPGSNASSQPFVRRKGGRVHTRMGHRAAAAAHSWE